MEFHSAPDMEVSWAWQDIVDILDHELNVVRFCLPDLSAGDLPFLHTLPPCPCSLPAPPPGLVGISPCWEGAQPCLPRHYCPNQSPVYQLRLCQPQSFIGHLTFCPSALQCLLLPHECHWRPGTAVPLLYGRPPPFTHPPAPTSWSH